MCYLKIRLDARCLVSFYNSFFHSCTALGHPLELEKLENEHLRQHVSDQKQLIENYQQQMNQLNKTLEKANASIHDFTQVRLLEFKSFELDDEPQPEKEKDDPICC